MPVENRVGAENDGWRVANVTLRFERGTAFAQHIITMRSQVLRLASLAKSRRGAARHGVGRSAPQDRAARRERRGALEDDADVRRGGRTHR